MDTLISDFLLSALERAIALGFIAAIVLWAFRQQPVVQRVRLSAVFSVVGWSAYWLISAGGREDLDNLIRTILAISLLLTINIGVQFFDLLVWEFGFKRAGRVTAPSVQLQTDGMPELSV